MSQRQQHTSIDSAARRTGLEPHTIRRCVRVGPISGSLTEDDLAELRRVRRLTGSEVNLAGVEIIVRMRRRIVELEAELARLRQQVSRKE